MGFEVVFFWLFFCVLVGMYANKLHRNPFGYGLLAAIISPLLAFLLLLVLGEAKDDGAVSESYDDNILITKVDDKNFIARIKGDDDWNYLKGFLKTNYLNIGELTSDGRFDFEISNGQQMVGMNRDHGKVKILFYGVDSSTFQKKFFTGKSDNISHSDPLETLEKISSLHKKGLITKEEFEEKKKQLLERI